MRALAVVALALAAVARASLPDNAADLPLTSLLALAQDALAQGKSHDALSIYDHCLEREPGDFATLYKRASVRLATGQLAKAREGFLDVLKVREYDVVHLQLAKIHAKLAEYADAKRELDTYLKTARKDKGAADKEVEEAAELVRNAISTAKASPLTPTYLQRKQVVAAQKELAAAEKARSSTPPNLDRCLASTSSALHLSPQSLSLRLLRAECALVSHDFDSAIGDLSRASALSPTLPPHLLVRIALLSAFFTDPAHSRPEITPDALLPLKRCLSSDPDSKTCAKPLKQLKALEKDLAKLRNWIDGARWTEAALEIVGTSSKEGVLTRVEGMLEAYRNPITRTAKADETPLPADDAKLADFSPLRRILHSTLCHAYVSISSRKSSAACAAALALDPEDAWGMVGKADDLMKKEEWEEAVRVLSQAFEATGRSERAILERLQKAQRLLKQSKSKVRIAHARLACAATSLNGSAGGTRSEPARLTFACLSRRTTTRSSVSLVTQTTRRSSGHSACTPPHLPLRRPTDSLAHAQPESDAQGASGQGGRQRGEDGAAERGV